jgi:hypothetical protein
MTVRSISPRVYERTFSAKRTPCPGCGARTGFAAYEDDPDEGYCHACTTLFVDRESRKRVWIPQKPKARDPPKKLDQKLLLEKARESIERTVAQVRDRIPIEASRFLNVIESMTSESIFKKYNCGVSPSGAIQFWYQDQNGQYVNCKQLRYGTDGFHRDKSTNAFFLYSKEDGGTQCLFGEHLLKSNRTQTVALVESEKSALILSHHFPKYLWLANGGASALKREKALPLAGRSVIIIFDADEAGEKGAQRTLDILRSVKAKSTIVNPADLVPLKKGEDLADHVYKAIVNV